jgi:ribosomal protein S27E
MNRLAQFLNGRNGIDLLNIALLVLAAIIGLFVHIPGAAIIFTAIQCALLVLAVFRMLSKNLEARHRENAIAAKVVYGLTSWVKPQLLKLKSRREFVFFKCPTCRDNIRVPRGLGRVSVTCRKCGERFQKKT